MAKMLGSKLLYSSRCNRSCREKLHQVNAINRSSPCKNTAAKLVHKRVIMIAHHHQKQARSIALRLLYAVQFFLYSCPSVYFSVLCPGVVLPFRAPTIGRCLVPRFAFETATFRKVLLSPEVNTCPFVRVIGPLSHILPRRAHNRFLLQPPREDLNFTILKSALNL